MTGNPMSVGAEVWADDAEDAEDLYAELSGIPGITAEAVSAPVQPGEQGAAFDVLMVSLSSGAVTAFLQIVKTLAEAKGPKFVLSIRRGKNQLKITADNFDEVEPAIRKLFGGR
jgi:Effector Associated Constant Component 1